MYMVYLGVAEAVKTIGKWQAPVRLVIEGDYFLCESLLCKVCCK